MNIFKVLASGRRSFSEESASVFLGWLLHPEMDHGMGPRFLKKLMEGIAKQSDCDFSEILEAMEPTLRSYDDRPNFDFELVLEKNLDGNVADIVLRVNNWWFLIENKIRSAALNRDKDQVFLQYEGLRKERNESNDDRENSHIAVVFLVPRTSIDTKDKKGLVMSELEKIENHGHKYGDVAVDAIWQSADDEDDEISIHDMIAEILAEENAGKSDPLPEHLRHTLKAFLVFIQNDFDGYRYKRKSSQGGINPDADGTLTLDQIRTHSDGYVGIRGGLSGLLSVEPDRLKPPRPFQYSSGNTMESKTNWMPLGEFRDIANWLLGGEAPKRTWEGKFSAKALYRIAQSYGDSVYIGIQGGVEGLKKLETAKSISSKGWKVGPEKRTGQWISGADFVEALKELGIDNPNDL